MRLFLLLPLLASIFPDGGGSESPAPVDPRVTLRISLDTSQREFHIGEIIPIKLFFSSRVKNHYQLDEATYDRSGRMNYERFKVTPEKGSVDPIPPDALSGMGGGMTNFSYLKPKPWSIRLNLNEWVRFDAPGEYKLTVSSERVGVKDPTSPSGASALTARSNEITLKILPLDRVWQERALAQAITTLKTNPSEGSRSGNEPPTPVEKAWDTLRFLGTVEAARELASRLRGESPGQHEFTCYMGLVSSPEHAAALDALKNALADPDRPINDTFLDTLRMVESEHHPKDPYTTEEQKRYEDGLTKVIEELIAVLPAKRGQALPISLSTAVNGAWNVKSFPQQTLDKLVEQLIAIFDQLPPHEQGNLLNDRWDKIGRPALLPIVRRYAQVSGDSLRARGADGWDSWNLTANAIKHWYELDPAGARLFIIKEITRPAPRFGAGELGILPDESLPEVETTLAEQFVAGADDDDFKGSTYVAQLIARYATPAILPKILDKFDPHIGKWACADQAPILAYILRADPQAARSRIERAIAARGKGFTGCYRRLFEEVAGIHYNAVLEEIGIRALDDRDLEVAMSAADMLGKFGSPAAESALLKRYEKWNQHWAGHESDLNLTLADDAENLRNERGLGNSLIVALAKGQRWFTDSVKLRRLAELTRVRSIRQDLDRYLKTWGDQPLSIDFRGYKFSASVAQYDFDSMDALEQKLTQFPSGTEFAVVGDAEKLREYLPRLRRFLASHGMSIKGKNGPE